jgi:DNA modification methylase
MTKKIRSKPYFYTSVSRKIVAVENDALNLEAKKVLQAIRKSEEYKSIPKKFQDRWNDVSLYHPTGSIEKADALILEPENGAYSLSNKLNHLTGKEWTKSIKSWFIFDAIHSDIKEEKEITQKAGLNSEDHPATYSPTMMAEFISFFTKEGDLVLDPFNGIGSTLVGCDRVGRRGVGIELNKKYFEITKLRTKQKVIHGSSEKIGSLLKRHKIKDINFSISSPPYWNILQRSTGSFEKKRSKKNLDIQYSDKDVDIGNIDSYEDFVNRLADIYFQIYDYLVPKAYLVVIVKNIKKAGRNYPLAWDLAKKLTEKYALKDEKIWCQDKVGLAPFGYPFAYTSNIVHHYCLIFRKE